MGWDFDEEYHLTSHNCMMFAQSVLNASSGEVTSEIVNHYNENTKTIVPILYAMGNKVAIGVSNVVDNFKSVKDSVSKFFKRIF